MSTLSFFFAVQFIKKSVISVWQTQDHKLIIHWAFLVWSILKDIPEGGHVGS